MCNLGFQQKRSLSLQKPMRNLRRQVEMFSICSLFSKLELFFLWYFSQTPKKQSKKRKSEKRAPDQDEPKRIALHSTPYVGNEPYYFINSKILISRVRNWSKLRCLLLTKKYIFSVTASTQVAKLTPEVQEAFVDQTAALSLRLVSLLKKSMSVHHTLNFPTRAPPSHTLSLKVLLLYKKINI